MYTRAYTLTHKLLIFIAMPALFWLSAIQATANSEPSLTDLDSEFQEVLDAFLASHSLQQSNSSFARTSALAREVKQTESALEASSIIRRHKNLIVEQATAKEFHGLIKRLYDNNDTATVRDLTIAINKQGNAQYTSINYYLLADYYAKRSNWPGVLAALAKVDSNLLSKADAQYYAMLHGFALQGEKKHRKAAKHYKTIVKNSPYYAHARLNEGTAYLKQGWWTEAHIEFENAIQQLEVNPGLGAEYSDFNNRILVTLGFSQIHYEFYRDARNTLRRVSLDSDYATKAMMGLGIAAAHQKDFTGALNIFQLLQEKQPQDKNVDESYLLVPFGFEELQDPAKAGLQYERAIEYFKARLGEIAKAQQQLEQASSGQLLNTIASLNQRSRELYASSTLIPDYFLDNFETLMAMQSIQSPTGVRSKVQALTDKYQRQIKNLVKQNITQRQQALNSYLSQAKFGVAKLYDQ